VAGWAALEGPSVIENTGQSTLPSGWQGFPISKFYWPNFTPCSPPCADVVTEYSPDLQLIGINALINLGLVGAIFAAVAIVNRHHPPQQHSAGAAPPVR
jgi:hypothetical protein